MIEIPENIQKLVQRYNFCAQINSLFCKLGKESEVVAKEVLGLDRFNRFDFVNEENRILKCADMLAFVRSFHGRSVTTPDGLKGTINQPDTYECDNRTIVLGAKILYEQLYLSVHVPNNCQATHYYPAAVLTLLD